MDAEAARLGELDDPAQMTGALGLGGLTAGLIELGGRGWSFPVTLGGFGLFILALHGFLLLERRARAPMLPLELFGRIVTKLG